MKTFSKEPSEKKHNRISCVLCRGDAAVPAWKTSESPFVRCRSCGLVYQNPQPEASELTERYDGEYFDYEIENESQFFNLMLLGLKDVGFAGEEKRILDACAGTACSPSFLDIGCATGRLLEHMMGRGWIVKGVEVCGPAARYGIAERGLDIHIGTIESAGLSSGSFDVIHCSHLIEHLTRPDLFLDEAARILKPGGLIIIVTPDVSGFQARLFGSSWRSAIADHMFLFSSRTLTRLLNNKGFNVIRRVSWGGLGAGTAPFLVKKAVDRLVKPIGAGDVVCIMGTI